MEENNIIVEKVDFFYGFLCGIADINKSDDAIQALKKEFEQVFYNQ